MRTFSIVATVVFAVSFSLSSGCSPESGNAESAAAPAVGEQTAAETYHLTVEGMGCSEACPPRVKSALETIPGVQSVEVDFENKLAVVRVDPGTTLTAEQCDKAFGNDGYFVDSIEARTASVERDGEKAAN